MNKKDSHFRDPHQIWGRIHGSAPLQIPESRQKSQIFLNMFMKNLDFWLKTRHSNPKFDKDHGNSTLFVIESLFPEIWATSGYFREIFVTICKKVLQLLFRVILAINSTDLPYDQRQFSLQPPRLATSS
ncbi:hypothetical protein OUZ56_019963 [Daphnia magna]|uniref:Uncharacterized protein n=1 Tax=Daphnia magna TaxID=35525 RepID=A0ABQ9ZD81_9CRUS|nr:hypothetical protein OUZ56_019963 [Daphnia magna]